MKEQVTITTMAIIAVLIGAFLAFVAARPNAFRIQRTTGIKASPEKLFAMINDLRQFNTWNPFAVADPNVKLTCSGALGGKGAAYDWQSVKMGVGRMEIVDTAPPLKVVAKLNFVKPVEAHNVVEFTLEPEGETTDVTWAMHGPMLFLSKLMTTFMSMDRMIGDEFEKGLANMMAAAEPESA